MERGGRVLEFTQTDRDELVVKATDSSGSITIEEKVFAYSCDEDGVSLRPRFHARDANVLGVIGTESFRFTRASDGSLVLFRRHGGVVLILGLIPGGYLSEATWFRFAPWNPPR